jgi:hypothetical protein
MTSTQAVAQALAVAGERLSRAPSAAMYQSIEAQLRYLQAVVNGTEPDRTRLKTLNFGHYAARELEDSDPEFANALFPAFYVATRMARGLKVESVPE